MSAGLLDGTAPPRADRLAALDPRLRILTAGWFALVTVALASPWTALGALALAASALLLSGAEAGRLRRLLPLELLMLVLLLTLPFSVPGEALASLGPVSASREGLALAVLILLKANAVVLALLALVGTLGPGALVQGLQGLRVPAKVCHLLLLTLRQIDLIDDEYRRLRLALRARAFVPRSDRHSWRTLGWLLGMLLVRSLARAQRVSDAMRCRGFDGRLRLLRGPRWRRRDSLALVALLPALGLLLIADPWLRPALG